MIGNPRTWFRRPLSRALWLAVGASALGIGIWCGRGWLLHRATAQQTIPSPEPVPEVASDYTTRVVAYIHGGQPITRQELGEYLIHRFGADKLPLLLNKRIVDDACRERNIEVTSAEVDAAFQESLKGLAIDKDTFVRTVLSRYKKNLFEWKEDNVRPQVQMSRLVQARLAVSETDLRRAYESAYGEKIDCRIILWPHSKEKEALEQFGRLRDSEAAFADAAKRQETSWLAGSGGKIKPIGRWSANETLEKEAFKLMPGQVSTLIRTPEGIVLLKCDNRIPPDTSVSFESVRDKLEAEIRNNRLNAEITSAFQALKEKAKPQPLLKKYDRLPAGPMPAPTQVVAYLYGSKPITREELGEFLIARYGAEKVEFLVNRKIIDHACAEKNIVVTEEEVDAAFDAELKLLKCDKNVFQKEYLSKYGKSLFEWREDVIRPRLMLTKMCQGRVTVTEEEIKKGYESYYGERLECRMILYPPDQKKFAMTEYAKLRDSEQEFANKAKSQASSTLAAQGGRIPIFGRHMLGDDNLEREAFKLQPGEVSELLETPQGYVLLKCDRRIPPDTSVKIEQVREQLTKEIHEKKVQMEMQVVFKELAAIAKPQLVLKNHSKPEDLLAETQKLLGTPPANGPAASASTPGGAK